MEKLCQAFENGKELVELSQASPHDISNVLKLYLRQVRALGIPPGEGKGRWLQELTAQSQTQAEPGRRGLWLGVLSALPAGSRAGMGRGPAA